MKKRSGVALVSTIVLLAFVLILSIASLAIYQASTKQNYIAKDNTQSYYYSVSGNNIVTAYITTKNAEFLLKYNKHVNDNTSSDVNGRTVPFEIPLDLDVVVTGGSNTATVEITSTQSSTSDVPPTITTTYNLNSRGVFNDQATNTKMNVIETEYNGSKTYEISAIR